MKEFHVEVYVRIKKSLLEPQGITIEKAMRRLGMQNIRNTRVGKLIEFDIEAENEDAAQTQVEEISNKLLANPVIEDFEYKVYQKCQD